MNWLTLILLVAKLANTKNAKILKIYRNPGIWLLIWEYSMRAIHWVPIWEGLDDLKYICVIVHWTKVALALEGLTRLTPRFLKCKAQGRKDFWKTFKPSHVGIHWIALTEYSKMSTHFQGFSHFSGFLHHFVLVKLANISIRVKVGREGVEKVTCPHHAALLYFLLVPTSLTHCLAL